MGRASYILKEAHQVKQTHGHPSCIQQLCKTNIQPWFSPSEIDRDDLKGEPTKYGLMLMEVD